MTFAMPLLMVAGLAACTLVDDEKDETAAQVYGRTWLAEEVADRPVVEGVEATLTVANDGKVNGNTGCNGFFGSVILDGSAMSFGNLGATRRLCAEEVSDQESRFLQALDLTRGYRVEGDQLLLLDEAGTPLARFRDNGEE